MFDSLFHANDGNALCDVGYLRGKKRSIQNGKSVFKMTKAKNTIKNLLRVKSASFSNRGVIYPYLDHGNSGTRNQYARNQYGWLARSRGIEKFGPWIRYEVGMEH